MQVPDSVCPQVTHKWTLTRRAQIAGRRGGLHSNSSPQVNPAAPRISRRYTSFIQVYTCCINAFISCPEGHLSASTPSSLQGLRAARQGPLVGKRDIRYCQLLRNQDSVAMAKTRTHALPTLREFAPTLKGQCPFAQQRACFNVMGQYYPRVVPAAPRTRYTYTGGKKKR